MGEGEGVLGEGRGQYQDGLSPLGRQAFLYFSMYGVQRRMGIHRFVPWSWICTANLTFGDCNPHVK